MPSRRRIDVQPLIALALVQLFFATFPVLGKVVLREVTPLVVTVCRVVLGALFLSIASRLLYPEEPRISARDRWTLLGLSLLGVVANQTLYILGLRDTTASEAVLLINTIPIFTFVIGVLMGRERAGWRRIVGIPLALTGTLVVLGTRGFDLTDPEHRGNFIIVGNCLAYSFFLVLSRGILRRRAALPVTAAVFRYAIVPVVLIALPDLARFHPATLSQGAVLGLIAIVLFPTVIAYALNAWALQRTDASTTAVFVYAQPLVTWILAFTFLGERPGARFALSAALVLSGVILTTWPGKSVPAEPAEISP